MAGGTVPGGGRRGRSAVWTAVGFILLIPLVAMQFTDEVKWGLADFALAGALLVGVGLLYERAVRRAGDPAYRAAVGLALLAALVLVWVNVAVGMIGSEDDEANLMYGGVLAIGAVGACTARFRPRGMAGALFATALAQVLVAVIVLVAGLGSSGNLLRDVVALNAFFVALFVGSALLFLKAARARPIEGGGPGDRSYPKAAQD